MTYPLRLLCSELAQGSGGAGQFRGGLGVRRDYQILDFEQKMTVYTEQARPCLAPWGLAGGERGASPRLSMTVDGREELFLRKDCVAHPGDVISVTTGGGGGFGDPRLRDPAAVERDVAFGYVTESQAHRSSGTLGAWEVRGRPAQSGFE